MELNYKLDDIDKAAKEFLNLISGYKLITFSGNLGAGKTTFIKAICKQLGVIENVSSPTYSIINQYQTKNSKCIYHADLYRLKNEEEAIEAGIEDLLKSNEICFIEWPEKASTFFEHDAVNTIINFISPDERNIEISLPS